MNIKLKRRPIIAYNVSDTPIVIVTKWHADPLGGPAIRDTTIMVKPGDGVDLLLVGLDLFKPTKVNG